MAIMQMLVQQIGPRLPNWVKRPIKEVLRRMGSKPPSVNHGELPADFLGEQRVRIGHKPFISGRDFPSAGPYIWLDRPDAETAIESKVQAGQLTQAQADGCRKFARDGYFTAEQLVPAAVIDAAIESYVQGRRDGLAGQ